MSDTNSPTPPEQPPLPPSAQDHPEVNGVASWIKRNSASVRGSTAAPVGQGLPRRHSQHVSPSPEDKKKAEPAPDHTLEEEWTDRPQLKDQIQREEGLYWKFDRTEAKVFDLTDAAQLQSYNELLTRSTAPDSNLVILQKESKWSDKSDNWKILVEVQYLKFRKILLTKKDE